MSTLKHAATLSIGNGVAQLITLAGTVLLARLYTPSQFGFLGIVMGVAMIAGVAAPCRYDMTILLPRSDRVAQLALVTAMLLTFATIAALGLVLLGISLWTHWQWAGYWPEICVAAFSLATVQTFNFKRNREKRYRDTVTVQIVRAIVMVAASAAFARSPGGLVHGFTIGCAAALLMTLAIEFRVERRPVLVFPRRRIAYWLRRNDEFLKFSLPAVLTSTFSAQLPIFLMSSYFGTQAAGYYSFINRTVMAPISLISGSLNTLYQQKTTSAAAHRKPIHPGIRNLTRKLALFSVVACLAFVAFCLLHGYGLVFGPAWRKLDELAIILTPILAVSFVSRCLPGFAVVGKNALGLVYQVAVAIGTFAAIWAAYHLWNDLKLMFVAYSATMSLLYFAQVVSINRIARDADRRLLPA